MTFNINLYALMFCAELLTRSLFSFYRSARFRPIGVSVRQIIVKGVFVLESI